MGWIAAVIACGYNHDNSVLPSLLDCLAKRIEFVALVDGAAQREVDHANVVARFQRDRLVDGGDHQAVGARAVGIEDAQVDDAGAGCDSFEGLGVLGAGGIKAIAGDEARDVSAVTVLIAGRRVSRHERLLIHHSRERKNAQVEIGMIAHAAVNQRHSDAGAGIARLPGKRGIHRDGGTAERWRQRPVGADVDDIRLIGEALDGVAVELGDDAIDQRQVCQNRAPKFNDIVYQAIHKAQQPVAIQLRSGRILHDDLNLLGRGIALQFGRQFRGVGMCCHRHRNDQE